MTFEAIAKHWLEPGFLPMSWSAMTSSSSSGDNGGTGGKKLLFMHQGDGGTGGKSDGQLFWGWNMDKSLPGSRIISKVIPTFKSEKFRCEVCDKSFATVSGMKGHESSKAHQQKLGIKSKIESRPHTHYFDIYYFWGCGEPHLI